MKAIYIEGECPKCGLGWCGEADLSPDTDAVNKEIADILACDVCGESVAPQIGVLTVQERRCDNCDHFQAVIPSKDRAREPWPGCHFARGGWGVCWLLTREDKDDGLMSMTQRDSWCARWEQHPTCAMEGSDE